MKTISYMMLFVVLVLLCGCSTQKGVITTSVSAGTITYNETKDGETSPYSMSVKTGSTIVSLDFTKPEPPTLPQLCTYAQEVFDQEIKPKLDAGQALSNEELAVLACCMNVRIHMMKALNGAILSSMDLPLDASPTYGVVAHPRLTPMLDVTNKNSSKMEFDRLNAERAFDEKLNGLASSFINERSPIIETWGQSFSGDGSFTLGLDERRKLLYCFLSYEQESLPSDNLHRSIWKRLYDWTGWLSFGILGEIPGAIIANTASKKELPNFADTYRQRTNNTKWKTGNPGYDTDISALNGMYSDVSNGVFRAKECTANEQNQQYDRLCDLERQFSEVVSNINHSQCLVEDYPFAIMLFECMKMMGWYYKREYHGHTPDRVQRKYELVAKQLCTFVKSMNIKEIHQKAIIGVYEDTYVAFLKKSLNKTSEDLFRDGLIPFLPERAK